MKRKTAALILAAVVGTFSGAAGCAGQESVPEYDPYAYFWEGGIVQNETVVLSEQDDGSISGNLLFTPAEILSVKNYTLQKTYDSGEYRTEGNALIATESSTMPFMTQAMLRGEEGNDEFMWSSYDTGYVYTEGIGIVMHQVAVTYRYDPSETWGYIPEYRGDRLVNSMAKLERGENMHLFLFGDSISYGCNSSKVLGTEPYLPSYGEGLCGRLSEIYGAEVRFSNGSVGGWLSAEGVKNIKSAYEVAAKNYGAPDLAVLAFGMNDASHKVPVETYKANMQTIIDSVREINANADIVIISTIHANPQGSQDKALPAAYSAADKELCAENERTVNVDMTRFSELLYGKKKGVDILANNVNHPSDFLVRCYDMCLLKTLTK